MTGPNFFVVGAPKAGTSSLYHYLSEHPDIFLPRIKEPHFFSSPEVISSYYDVDVISNEKKYFDLYNNAGNYKAIGDLSTSYLYNSESAKRIYEYNPESKIIVVLRNPIERAISHYLMDVNLGYQNDSLHSILISNSNNKYYAEYVGNGLYFSNLRDYYDAFRSDQILVLLAEDLAKNSASTVRIIYKFLGVDATVVPNTDVRSNQYRQTRFKHSSLIKKFRFILRYTSLMPDFMKVIIKTILYKKDTVKPKFENEKDILKEIYLDDTLKTGKLINKDLTAWMK